MRCLLYTSYQVIENLPAILSTPLMYIFDNIVLILWYAGVQMLIVLAGLQKIGDSLYEAASIDGASAWQSFWKITLPDLLSLIHIFKQFVDQLPEELVESARIDGATDYGILFKIVVPLVKPSLATVAILLFQNAWNLSLIHISIALSFFGSFGGRIVSQPPKRRSRRPAHTRCRTQPRCV